MSDQSMHHVPKRITLLTILSLVGLAASVALTLHHYDLKSGAASFKSICNIGSSMNCDLVAVSKYAELLPGLPLSSVTAAWFLMMFLATLFARNAYWRRESLRATLILSGIGSIATLVYLGIMAFVLKTGCLYCIVVDVVNISSLALVLSLKPEGFKSAPIDRSKWKTFLILAALSLVFVPLILTTNNRVKISENDIVQISQSVLNSAPLAVQTGSDLPILGNPNAPITIVEFSDFQCPYCRNGATILNAVLNRYPNEVKVVFRNFPLDSACNPRITHRGHPVACEAAKVAVCAQKVGKFKPVYEEIFEKQSDLKPGLPIAIATELGLDQAAMKACLESPETAAKITQDLQVGEQLGVQSTPTFFINGHRVEGAFPVPVWERIIETLLAKK